ncbi:MAG: zinc ribbon domain-containing protein [Gemmatimonadaceae bacterium]
MSPANRPTPGLRVGRLSVSDVAPTECQTVPTYEYRCTSCGESFSRTERISDHPSNRPTCPKCKSDRVEQTFSSVYVKTAKKS